MNAIPARVTQGGRLIIPAAIRKAMKIADGEIVMLQVEGNVLRITTVDDQIDAFQAFCAPLLGEGVVDEFIADRRRAAEKENG